LFEFLATWAKIQIKTSPLGVIAKPVGNTIMRESRRSGGLHASIQSNQLGFNSRVTLRATKRTTNYLPLMNAVSNADFKIADQFYSTKVLKALTWH